MIRVLIAEDHVLVRSRLGALLQREGDIEIVGEARDGQEAIQLTEQLTPDVVLMDVQMPRVDGIRATRRILTRCKTTRILMIATFWALPLIHASIKLGARGCLAKTEAFAELVPAIRTLCEGKSYFSKTISTLLAHNEPQ